LKTQLKFSEINPALMEIASHFNCVQKLSAVGVVIY